MRDDNIEKSLQERVAIFQKQSKLHGNGVTGNCMMTCWANMLGLDHDHIPPIEELFYTKVPETGFWWSCYNLWFEQLGYQLVRTDNELEAMNNTCDPDGLYCAYGSTSRSEALHQVIFKNRQLVHDPHPDNTGITYAVQFEYLITNPPLTVPHK